MSCRRHALYLSEEEGRSVRQVLLEYGYNYRQTADALSTTRNYDGRNLSRSFISMALRGKRGLPDAMIYGLLEIVNNDSRLQFLLRGTSPIQPTAEDHFEGLFLDYEHQLRGLYKGLSKEGKLEILQGLEQLVQKIEKTKREKKK
ncbi:hypothetical protein HYX12_01855 [Candidatus Woesearchaeota archaeon]|nr:hypothetical protein [Candidatus Woesearchaeota archaeon]